MQIQSLIGQLFQGGKGGGCKSCGGGLDVIKKLLSGLLGGGDSQGKSCSNGGCGKGCAGCSGRNCARCKGLGF